jgi:nucleotidyltransferase substrate binding protein (TIGR01987 family)
MPILLTPLEKAIAQLEAGLQTMSTNPTDDLHRDGVIQRFEYTMDLAWKLLQRFLTQHFQVQDAAIRSKKDIFREAARLRLIADAEQWIGHYEARNETSHDYNQDKADAVFERAKMFLPDVQDLLEVLRRVS